MALREEPSQTPHPVPGWFCCFACAVWPGGRVRGKLWVPPCQDSCVAMLHVAKILGRQEFTVMAVLSFCSWVFQGLAVELRLSSFVAFGMARAGAHLPTSPCSISSANPCSSRSALLLTPFSSGCCGVDWIPAGFAPCPALVWLCHGLHFSPGGAESLEQATKVPICDGMRCSICPSRSLHGGVAAGPCVATWRILSAQGLVVAEDLQTSL